MKISNDFGYYGEWNSGAVLLLLVTESDSGRMFTSDCFRSETLGPFQGGLRDYNKLDISEYGEEKEYRFAGSYLR